MNRHECPQGHVSYSALSEPDDRRECPVCHPTEADYTCPNCGVSSHSQYIAMLRREVESLNSDLVDAYTRINRLKTQLREATGSTDFDQLMNETYGGAEVEA
jgi:hypothetical protein